MTIDRLLAEAYKFKFSISPVVISYYQQIKFVLGAIPQETDCHDRTPGVKLNNRKVE
jgi:hypothetical protein